MAAVWTAMSLQRSDIASNSLSRSLGSLMMPPMDDEEHSATVILHSNMATEPYPSTNEPQSRESMDSETRSSAPFVRQVSAPIPHFQKLVTNSASSITFLGKRITREYQSHFVLPDKQMVAVTRRETFLPEEAQSEVLLSLSLAAPPEVVDTTVVRGPTRMKKRIFDYLDPGDWASAILASSESRDAELLGRLGAKYSSSVARKTRLERSTSRKSRQEVVMARELYSDDDDEEEEEVEEEEKDVREMEEEGKFDRMDQHGHLSFDDESTLSKIRDIPRPSPVQSKRETPSSNFTPSPSFAHPVTPRPVSGGLSARSMSPNTVRTPPPIIAHSDRSTTKIKPLSDVRSRLNFEELRRKWDERVAREQMYLDEQWEGGHATSAQTTPRVPLHEGHRGTAVTSILPTVSRKTRSGDEQSRGKSSTTGRYEFTEPITQAIPSESPYLANRTNTLSDRMFKSSTSPRTTPGSDYGELYPQSPHSVHSEPTTEREEKEARFSYSHEKLLVGQENIGHLDPFLRGTRRLTPSDAQSKRSPQQFDQSFSAFPGTLPHQHAGRMEDRILSESKPALPPRLAPTEPPGTHLNLWERRQRSKTVYIDHDEETLQIGSVRPQSIPSISRLDKEKNRDWIREREKNGEKTVSHQELEALGRPRQKMPPQPPSDKPRGQHRMHDDRAAVVERRESSRKAERAISRATEIAIAHDDFILSPEPMEPRSPEEFQMPHSETPLTSMGQWRKVRSDLPSKYTESQQVPASRYPIRPSDLENKETAHRPPVDSDRFPGKKPSEQEYGIPFDAGEETTLSLLAPQPYRRLVPSKKPSSTEIETSKPQDSTTKSGRKPRPVSLSSFTPDSASTEGKMGSKLVRRWSHLDQYLDEQIDKAYTEELSRRTSVRSDRGPSVDRESSSGLSVLATYEEQRQARQIENMLRPGKTRGKIRESEELKQPDVAPSRQFKFSGKAKEPQVGGRAAFPTEPEESSTGASRPTYDDGHKYIGRDRLYPSGLDQNQAEEQHVSSAHDLSASEAPNGSGLVRGETKRRPITRSSSVKQTDQLKPDTNAVVSDRQRDKSAPLPTSESRFAEYEPSKLPSSSLDDQTPKRDVHAPADARTHKRRSLTEPEAHRDYRRETSTRKQPMDSLVSSVQDKVAVKGAADFDRDFDKQYRERLSSDRDKKHRETLKEHRADSKKTEQQTPGIARSASDRESQKAGDYDSKRRSMHAGHSDRVPRENARLEKQKRDCSKELGDQKRPISLGGKLGLDDKARSPDDSALWSKQSTWPGKMSEQALRGRKGASKTGVSEWPPFNQQPSTSRTQNSKLSKPTHGGEPMGRETSRQNRSDSQRSNQKDQPEKHSHSSAKSPVQLADRTSKPISGMRPTHERDRSTGKRTKANVPVEPASTDWPLDHQGRYTKPPSQRGDEFARDENQDRIGHPKRGSRDFEGRPDSRRHDPTDSESTGERYGRKRHPPPPTSPPMRQGTRWPSGQEPAANQYFPRGPTSGEPERPEQLPQYSSSSRQPNQDLSNGGPGGRAKGDSHRPPGRHGHSRQGDEQGRSDSLHWVPPHPDEYNLHDEARQSRHSTTGEREPDMFGAPKSGERRKRPDSQAQEPKRSDRSDRHSALPDKEKKSSRKTRHPSPPKPPAQRTEPKQHDYENRSKHGRRRHKPVNGEMDPPYENLPGPVLNGAQPWEEEWTKKSPEYSERSNEHSSYDPRVSDIGAMESRRPAHRPPPPPPHPASTAVTAPSPHTPKEHRQEGSRHSKRTPVVTPRKQTMGPTEPVKPSAVDRKYHDENDDDDDDYDEDSEEDLKPPPLRIPQNKKSADPVIPSHRHSGGSTTQHKASSRGSRQMPKPQPSPRGSLLSPGAMSAPSLPGYFGGGPLDKSHRGTHYRPEQFHPHHYEQVPHERPSRPRSKRTTATSQDFEPRGASGSKHSLIISTKRRTLSGVTGVNPIKQRSNSMNALWFGDHPVPSPGALSPNAPLRLSNIQLQAQAELERRHRSMSRAHSLDRRSGLSYGYGTESHLSRAPTDIEGYEGVGYGYDPKGRLIHGGAPLYERAISRKRRLLDGHESLSRVWIPQTDAEPTVRSEDPSPSAATRLTERKANLDDSAVAFALRDFTTPGVRRASVGDGLSELSTTSEHIYARPSSLLQGSETDLHLGSARDYGRRTQSHLGGQTLGRDSHLYSSRGLYRSGRLRRPRLVPNRWGSVPLPNSTQYDSLMHLSAHSLASRSSLTDTKYVLESNV